MGYCDAAAPAHGHPVSTLQCFCRRFRRPSCLPAQHTAVLATTDAAAAVVTELEAAAARRPCQPRLLRHCPPSFPPSPIFFNPSLDRPGGGRVAETRVGNL